MLFRFSTIIQRYHYCKIPIKNPKITVPESSLELNFSKSSGPGGQNVNKRNTKVVIRFKLANANWMSDQIKKIFEERNRMYIHENGYFQISSQKYRTQEENRKSCLRRLQKLVDDAVRQANGEIPKEDLKILKKKKSKQKLHKRAVKKVEALKNSDNSSS